MSLEDSLEDEGPFNVSVSAMLSAAVILGYDYFCTLDYEIKYVWKRAPFSITTFIFVLNRYLPFVDMIVSLHVSLSVVSAKQCTDTYIVIAWFTLIGVAISEAILFLRTYAIWNKTRAMLISLSILYCGCFIPAVVLMQLQAQSLEYAPAILFGCKLVKVDIIGFFLYLLLALLESIIAVLTLIKAYAHLRLTREGWVVQLYRDGLLFFLYIFATSLANILLPVAANGRFVNTLAAHLRVLHSVLCTRVMFLILRQRSRSSPSPSPSPTTSFIDHSNTYRHRRNNHEPSGVFTTIIDDSEIPDSPTTNSFFISSSDPNSTHGNQSLDQIELSTLNGTPRPFASKGMKATLSHSGRNYGFAIDENFPSSSSSSSHPGPPVFAQPPAAYPMRIV